MRANENTCRFSRRGANILWAFTLSTALWAGSGRAEPFVLPPPPDAHPPQLAGEFRADLVLPLHTTALCPASSECVLGNGMGVGLTGWYRWWRGSGVGIGYDLWILDGNGVYELSSIHHLRVGFRQNFLPEKLAHPFVGASLGIVLVGDTFLADGVGGALDVTAGVELEITESLAFTAALAMRLMSTSAFVSATDGVRRSDPFGVNAITMVRLGLVLLPSR